MQSIIYKTTSKTSCILFACKFTYSKLQLDCFDLFSFMILDLVISNSKLYKRERNPYFNLVFCVPCLSVKTNRLRNEN